MQTPSRLGRGTPPHFLPNRRPRVAGLGLAVPQLLDRVVAPLIITMARFSTTRERRRIIENDRYVSP